MGMIFNNYWEMFCRTYLELNGYFVLSNLFADLHDLRASHPHEADLVAYKIPGTQIRFARDKLASENSGDARAFWAGDDKDELVYCEVRANFTLNTPHQSIADLVTGKDRAAVDKKVALVNARFPSGDSDAPRKATVVIMAEYLDEKLKKDIAANPGWKYKTFADMFDFIERRFEIHGAEKLRILYNDPCLEIIRYLAIRRDRGASQAVPSPDVR